MLDCDYDYVFLGMNVRYSILKSITEKEVIEKFLPDDVHILY